MSISRQQVEVQVPKTSSTHTRGNGHDDESPSPSPPFKGGMHQTYKKAANIPQEHCSDQQVKKRFRTKFTQEQKEKMLSFAERAGWRIQKQEESLVQQFCQEIGIKRRVLKVWMHNNKNLARKNPSTD
ncbi:unnamed protein product, partial [Vitis vinifera]